MAFKAKTVIGLEVTFSKIKLVEVVYSASGMKITNFAVFDYSSDLKTNAKTTKQIKDAIGRTVLNAKEIYGVVSGPLIEHRIILLPPMTEKEMNAVTKREASKGGETALQNVSFGFDVVGQIDMGGIKKTAVLIVTAPHELVKEQRLAMESMGICLKGIATVPLALYHTLLQSRYCSSGDTTALIYLGIKSACIIMVSDDSLLFSREFSLISSAEKTEENYIERLRMEVKRSFLYFKQRYRGKEVSKVVLSGDISEWRVRSQESGVGTQDSISGMDLKNLAELLAKELDIGVGVFCVPEGLEIFLPHEKMPEFQGLLPSLTIPIGLAIAGVRQSRINLLSQKGICGKGIWRTDAILRIASAVLLLMLFGSYLCISITSFFTIRTKLDTLKALESLRPGLENVNMLEKERHEHAARLLLIERLNTSSPSASGGLDWSELFREISWLVSDDIVFNTFEVRQGKEGGKRITIEVKTSAKGRFNEFLSCLKNSSSLSVLKSESRVASHKVWNWGSKTHDSGPTTQDSELVFVIECEVRQ